MMSIRFGINWETESSGNEADCESDFDTERVSSHRVTSRRCSIGKATNKSRSSVASEETTANSYTSGANASGKKTIHKVVATLIESAKCPLSSTSEEEPVSKMGASLLAPAVACMKRSVSNDNLSDSSCYSSCNDYTTDSCLYAHSETEIDSESDEQRKPGDPCDLETLKSDCIVKLQSITTEEKTSSAAPMDTDLAVADISSYKRINVVN